MRERGKVGEEKEKKGIRGKMREKGKVGEKKEKKG
jgi:hypothetical protein